MMEAMKTWGWRFPRWCSVFKQPWDQTPALSRPSLTDFWVAPVHFLFGLEDGEGHGWKDAEAQSPC